MAEMQTAPLSPSTGERRWSLAAAISCVTIFGLTVGLGAPLLSLVLEARGTDATLNGLNAAATFVGVILGPLLTPGLVRRVGIRAFLLACLCLDVGFFLMLKLFDGIAVWFALRVALGFVGSSIFTTAEAWINLLATDEGRGRILGLYAAALSGGFAIGPLLLSVTGVAGWTPFVAASLLTAVAALPLLGAGAAARDLGRERAGGPLAMLVRAPFIMLAVALFGLFESTVQALLPVWGMRLGFGTTLSAASLSAVYLGSIALQLPVGWLSDKMDRLTVLRLCGAAGLVGAMLLMVAGGITPALFGLLFLWGGIAAGIYPVALGMAGDRFQGAELVSANAAVIIAYGLGALLGPALGGAAIDLWNPHGLLALLSLLFALFLAVTLLRRPDPADRARG